MPGKYISSRATSSAKWREFYAPFMLKLIEKFIEIRNVKDIYSIEIFLYSQKNIEDIINFFRTGDYQQIEKVSVLPTDFDVVMYHLCRLIYIDCSDENYFAVVNQEWNGPEFNPQLVHLEKMSSPIDINLFAGRSLIYPT